ncbi:hypothetical protein [Xanthomonas campestris]|uniref:hypothetical protein n=1 Tax=Xanthomonas campestris TaxID=339 RepID=UPI002B236EB4|nr:hypothetical protein [Xanthomonas campestris]MEA9901135.1 hypothetical protein [Xanthomonas campestris pv. raphani]
MRLGEFLCQRACLGIRQGLGQRFGTRLHLAALRAEGAQVLVQLCRVAAADQHIFPFLHLHAEIAGDLFARRCLRHFQRHLAGQAQPRGSQAPERAQQDNR